jgi:hypothetical protein
MATRTITETDCDRCEKRKTTVTEIRLQTHTESDPAGGHSEPCGIAFDLCAECMGVLLRKSVANVAFNDAVKIPGLWGVKHKREW